MFDELLRTSQAFLNRQNEPIFPIFSVFFKALESIYIINKNRKYFWELKNKKECYSIVFSKIFLKINGENMKKYGQNGNFGAIFSAFKMFDVRTQMFKFACRTSNTCSICLMFDFAKVRHVRCSHF